jgi:hypothetical protein
MGRKEAQAAQNQLQPEPALEVPPLGGGLVRGKVWKKPETAHVAARGQLKPGLHAL